MMYIRIGKLVRKENNENIIKIRKDWNENNEIRKLEMRRIKSIKDV